MELNAVLYTRLNKQQVYPVQKSNVLLSSEDVVDYCRNSLGDN